LKVAEKGLLRDQTLGRELDHVVSMFRPCELAKMNFTVRSTWEKAGFGLEQQAEQRIPLLTKTKSELFRNLRNYEQSIIPKAGYRLESVNRHAGGSTISFSE
jgi:hypothetical protein